MASVHVIATALLLIMFAMSTAALSNTFHCNMIATRLPTKLFAVTVNPQWLINSADTFQRISRIRGGMNLRVKTLAGKTITVTADKTDSIEALKSKIATEAGIPLQQQRLLLSGKQLDNARTVGDYEELEDNSVLHLVLRLRGGFVSLV